MTPQNPRPNAPKASFGALNAPKASFGASPDRRAWPLLVPYLVGLVLLVGVPTLVVLVLALT
jgi:hypothetical protein